MSRIGPQGPLLEQAQTLALEMIDNGQDRDRFVLQSTLWPRIVQSSMESVTARAE